MLVLTRSIGEKIVIGKNIRIKVLECQGGKTRLGIEAPREYSVHREEIYDRILSGMGDTTPKPKVIKKRVDRTIGEPKKEFSDEEISENR